MLLALRCASTALEAEVLLTLHAFDQIYVISLSRVQFVTFGALDHEFIGDLEDTSLGILVKFIF